MFYCVKSLIWSSQEEVPLTDGRRHTPSQYLSAQCIDIREAWVIVVIGEAQTSRNRINFLLGSFLDFWIQDENSEERV